MSKKGAKRNGAAKASAPVEAKKEAATAQAAPAAAASTSPPPSPSSSRQKGAAYLPDSVIAQHWIFRVIVWFTVWFAKSINTYDAEHVTENRDRAVLFFMRHSTHNSDILTTLILCWEGSGRVVRMLLHKLIVLWLPWIQYIGGVAGERHTAVDLLKEGFWCGVIPGGADEGLVGHENAYRLHWPASRVGFAKVAMEANAVLVPFMVRNGEESRFNPLIELWRLARLHLVYHWVIRARIPVVSSVVHTLAHCVWFIATFFHIPVPVRCTMIFADPVPYDTSVDTVEDVANRCRDALQALIDERQPNAREGRNYARALGERWLEWRESHPRLTRGIESATPAFVKRALRNAAHGRKKAA